MAVPDDPHVLLARLDERVDALTRRIDKVEDAILEIPVSVRAEHSRLERVVKETINGRIAAVEAKNILVRGIVLGACVIILTTFLGGVAAYFIGIPSRGLPTLPQPYTIPSTP